MSALTDILDAMAAALNEVVGPEALEDSYIQVLPRINFNPSRPTSIDIYPADTFRVPETAGFGDIDGAYVLTVRARVKTADAEGSQEALLHLMDDEHDLCLAAALHADDTLGGVVSQLAVDGNTGFRTFEDPPGLMLGCAWRVRVIP